CVSRIRAGLQSRAGGAGTKPLRRLLRLWIWRGAPLAGRQYGTRGKGGQRSLALELLHRCNGGWRRRAVGARWTPAEPSLIRDARPRLLRSAPELRNFPVENLGELRAVEIPARDNADDLSRTGLPGERRRDRRGTGPFGNHAIAFNQEANRIG